METEQPVLVILLRDFRALSRTVPGTARFGLRAGSDQEEDDIDSRKTIMFVSAPHSAALRLRGEASLAFGKFPLREGKCLADCAGMGRAYAIVVATSFADLNDLAAYQKAIAKGKSEAEALKVGDNGIGIWGDKTARDDVAMCALPREDWESKWGVGNAARGKKVSVTYKGKTVVGELQDTMPRKANIRNGAGIDLNPGFAKAFALTPPFTIKDVRWEWL